MKAINTQEKAWCKDWLTAWTYMIQQLSDPIEFTEERLGWLIQVEVAGKKRKHLLTRLMGRYYKLRKARELTEIEKGLFMARDKEGVIETHLIEEVEKMGGRCVKMNPNKERGFPDRLCILPQGVVFFIECKTAAGVLSPPQVRWGKRLINLLQAYAVVDSISSVDWTVKIMKREITERMQST